MMGLKDAIMRSLVLLGMAGITIGLCLAFPNAAGRSESGMELRLPDRVPGRGTFELPISKEEKHWLPADTKILKRGYYPLDALDRDEALQRSILATLIQSGSDQRSLHRPEVCLDAQGWAIQREDVVPIPVNGKTLKVMDLTLERLEKQRDGSLKPLRAHYIYWWIGKGRSTPSTLWRSLYSFYDNMFHNRNSVWGYPSVHVAVDTDAVDPAEADTEARREAYEFIRDYAPLFQKSLGMED